MGGCPVLSLPPFFLSLSLFLFYAVPLLLLTSSVLWNLGSRVIVLLTLFQNWYVTVRREARQHRWSMDNRCCVGCGWYSPSVPSVVFPWIVILPRVCEGRGKGKGRRGYQKNVSMISASLLPLAWRSVLPLVCFSFLSVSSYVRGRGLNGERAEEERSLETSRCSTAAQERLPSGRRREAESAPFSMPACRASFLLSRKEVVCTCRTSICNVYIAVDRYTRTDAYR